MRYLVFTIYCFVNFLFVLLLYFYIEIGHVLFLVEKKSNFKMISYLLLCIPLFLL